MKKDNIAGIIFVIIFLIIIIFSFFRNYKISKRSIVFREFPETLVIESNVNIPHVTLIAKTLASEILHNDSIKVIISLMEEEFPIRNGIRTEAYIIKAEALPHAYIIKVSSLIKTQTAFIRVISHEFAHIKQYESGDLVPIDQYNGIFLWKGDTLRMREIPYKQRPHEISARIEGRHIEFKLTEILYQ